jgi:hypothetical protein
MHAPSVEADGSRALTEARLPEYVCVAVFLSLQYPDSFETRP